MPSPLSILVTGAAGFIGSHLTEALLDLGHRVIGIDNFDPFYDPRMKRENLRIADGHGNFTFHEADIRSPHLADLVRGTPIDAIIHIAAKAGVRPSLEDPRGYYSVNVDGTLNLLELARDQGIPRFLFASSSSVYGENPHRPWSEADANLSPISPYAATKLACEQLGHVYSQLHGIQFLAMRFFTVYGPRQRPDLAIRKFVECIEQGTPISLFGDGSTSRDYTYVGDIVAGIASLLACESAPSFDILNLGNGTPITLLQMVETIARQMNHEPAIDFQPMQPGDVTHTLADISKAREKIGYHPQTTFSQGIQSFLTWHHRASL